jgi:hypothetical protein
MATDENKLNSAKGRTSYDTTTGNVLVAFFNRNVSTYATEAGGPKFDLVPVEQQKDLMINHARMYAQQEYNRIMEMVAVLQRQADDLKRRLDITDMVYAAEYQFAPVMGNVYWIVHVNDKQKTILTMTAPTGWNTSKPINYDYVAQVKYMGDHTWMEVKEQHGN